MDILVFPRGGNPVFNQPTPWVTFIAIYIPSIQEGYPRNRNQARKTRSHIHPGRWTAGSPPNHPFRKGNDLNQTSVNMCKMLIFMIQGCTCSSWFLWRTCFFSWCLNCSERENSFLPKSKVNKETSSILDLKTLSPAHWLLPLGCRFLFPSRVPSGPFRPDGGTAGGKSRRDDGAAVMAGGPGVGLWCCTKHSKHQGQSEGKPNHSDACSEKIGHFPGIPKVGLLKRSPGSFQLYVGP